MNSLTALNSMADRVDKEIERLQKIEAIILTKPELLELVPELKELVKRAA